MENYYGRIKRLSENLKEISLVQVCANAAKVIGEEELERTKQTDVLVSLGAQRDQINKLISDIK